MSTASVALGIVALLSALPTLAQPGPRPGVQLRDVSIQTTHKSFSILAVDLNHDERMDIVAADASGGHVYTYLGNGDGTFAAAIDVGKLGNNLRGLGAADFNRDGRVDLAVGVTQEGLVQVLNGLGDGHFSAPRSYQVSAHPFMLTVADLNADGIPDVAVSCETPGGVDVLLADGRGGFRSSRLAAGKRSSDVAAADLDEDGKIDLAVTNWGDNDVSLLFGTGGGAFAAPRSVTYDGGPLEHHTLYRVLAADLDRDGHLDMLWNDLITAALYIRYGDGRGAFPRTRSVPAGRGVRHAAVADLDGNGWLDLVSANTAMANLSVMLSDGSGGYLPTQYVPAGDHPRTVALADFNGDGRVDVAAANMMSSRITVVLNEGLTTLSADQDHVMGLKPERSHDSAGLSTLAGIAADPRGLLVVADEGGNRVVRIDPGNGTSTTIAGTGRAGDTGDGGPATSASLDRPTAVALAADGGVLIADFGNHRVRRVDAAGTITTLAGTGRRGFSGDGGPATSAAISYPHGLAVDGSGNVFIADSGNHRVRKIDANGVLTTVAGNGTIGPPADGTPATRAAMSAVTGLAIARDGSLLIADQQGTCIRKVDADGMITTIAGGKKGGGPAAAPQLSSPTNLAVAADGSLLVADIGARAIRRIAPDGSMSSVVSSEPHAPANRSAEGRPWIPYGIAVTSEGIIYFTDRNDQCVRRVNPDGTVGVVAGCADTGSVVTYDVTAVAESLPLQSADVLQPPVRLLWEHHFFSGSDDNAARGVTVGGDGSVYVAGDVGTGADFHVLQLSSSGQPGWRFDFAGPNIDIASAIANTPDGHLVVAGTTVEPEPQRRNVLVVALTPAGKELWRFTEPDTGDQNGYAVAVDHSGNVIVAGDSNHRPCVWGLSADGQRRWRYTGKAGIANGVAVDGTGTAYIAASESNSWRVVALRSDGSLAWQHGIAGPGAANGIAVDAGGNIIVTGSRTPRRLTLRAEKLSPAGTVLWDYEAISDAGAALGRAVAVSPDGTPIIVGEIATDWLVLALDANGKRRWHFSHDGGGQFKNRDQPFAVALQPSGQFVVAGRVHPLPLKPPSLGQVEWRVASYTAAP